MNALNRTLIVGSIMAFGTGVAWTADAQSQPDSSDKYRANEVSLDLFGTGSVNQDTLDNFSRHLVRENGRLGYGAGLDYFITRYIGFGAEAYTENPNHDPFVNDAGGNVYLRLPIGNSGFAPYIFGGGGRQFYPVSQTYEDGGAGFEFRFTHNIGLFVDGRYVFAETSENYGLGRAGLRLTF